MCSVVQKETHKPGSKTLWSSEPGPCWELGRRERAMLRGCPSGRVQRPPTHLGPAYWNLYRTDLAKLLIFYKDLNQRSIVESPANSVSGFLLGPVPGLGEQSQIVRVQPELVGSPKANQASDQAE